MSYFASFYAKNIEANADFQVSQGRQVVLNTSCPDTVQIPLGIVRFVVSRFRRPLKHAMYSLTVSIRLCGDLWRKP